MIDLHGISNEAIRGEIWYRVFQLILKHIFDPDLIDRLPDILGLVEELIYQRSGIEMLSTVLRYVARAGRGVTREKLSIVVEQIVPKEGGFLMKTMAEEWIEEGEARGEARGKALGEASGLAKGVAAQQTTLLAILQHKFKPNETETASLRTLIHPIDDLQQLVRLCNEALLTPSLVEFVQRMTQEAEATKVKRTSNAKLEPAR